MFSTSSRSLLSELRPCAKRICSLNVFCWYQLWGWVKRIVRHSRSYRDGFLTKTNTFQKFYAPGELESLIEQTLDLEANTLGLGICVVFRSDQEAELFEANRNRRRIDWTEISAQLKFSAPVSRERRSVDRYELHKELFEQFWQTLLDLGRAPEPGEFDRLAEVTKGPLVE